MKKIAYRLTLEYDGTDFNGWQSQPKGRTIQDELETAIEKLFQEKIRVVAAGRTDAGVHAFGQVVNFQSTRRRSVDEVYLGLNSLLPEDIRVLEAEEVRPEFHARFDARFRSYRYQIFRGNSAIWRRYAWCLRERLNVHDMQRCSELILGENSFRSFCSANAEVDQYNCRVTKAWWRYESPQLLVFSITANRFLHNMVRILVGTMVEVGRGRFSVEDFQAMLSAEDRRAAGLTAPACGLFLERVTYS